jgi:hypothetical protein
MACDCKNTYQKVSYVFKTYVENEDITAEECNAIEFINKGVITCSVNDLPLTTDQSLSLSGNQTDKDISSYTLSFIAGAGVRQMVVVRKYLIDN